MRQGNAKGFTLIELVTVLVVLGVVSVGIAGFIRTGTDIYVDVVERDQILSEGRFVVERLKREVTNALPNSLRVGGDASIQCIEFVPVLFSSFYFDIPVAPEDPSDTVKVVATSASTSTYSYQSGHSIVVYPTSINDVYGSASKRFLLDSAPTLDPDDNKKLIITLTSDVQFSTDSPSSRAYIVGGPVSYCVTNKQIYRHADYGFNTSQSTSLSNGVLMAENIQNNLNGSAQDKPFRISQATLTRNAFILMLLRFELNDELVVFNNEVHIPNAP
ncbi:prepilin-type N-terminal cleavage/methylation domain-containing protein [Aliiglaciecola litoralis]|uniref:Type II secretion system protein n=1 Tax=Aliiglaciecola litoralis TaxID=582857 RepID=A0ABP3WTK8_9ALTE